jgi:hypothetical protein
MTAQTNTAGRLARVPGETLLRWALEIDALVTGVNGVAYLAAAGALDSVLGVPAASLRWIGAFLVVYAAAVLYVATRRSISRPAVRGVIAANALWFVASIETAVFDWFSPTTGGSVWIVLQALVVAGFAAAQWYGLRRSS